MKTTRLLVAATAAVLQSMPGWAQDAAPAPSFARAAKNPFAEVISVPLLYDVNFGGGLGGKTQQVLTAQPLIPFSLNADWDLITRTIVPLISQPALAGNSGAHGVGDIQFSAFLSPDRTGLFDWGVGPVFLLPSAGDSVLGQGKWGAGPTAAAVWTGEQWTLGALVNNIWSVAGERGRPAVNQMQLQPLVNYFFRENPDRYLSFSPTVTANWKANGGERWTVPLSLGIGQVVKLGDQKVNLQATAFYNAIRPADAATWTLELQIQFLFPK